jgi:hypothetical protein
MGETITIMMMLLITIAGVLELFKDRSLCI